VCHCYIKLTSKCFVYLLKNRQVADVSSHDQTLVISLLITASAKKLWLPCWALVGLYSRTLYLTLLIVVSF
jgi:hypothetical protein